MTAVINDKYKIFNGAMLKNIAILSMAIDHAAACLIFNCIIKPNIPLTRTGPYWTLYEFYKVLRGIGRIAFPIFCFFIVEGFFYTHSRAKYLIRLFIFGLLSELPFDMALFRSYKYMDHQNVMFEMCMGIAMLWVFELLGRIDKIRPPELRLALQFASTVPFIVLAEKFSLDYGFKGMMLILLLYVLRENRFLQCVAGAIFIGMWEWPAIFAFIPMLLYNGQRGKQHKYFFYAFYPGHLLILWLIAYFVLHMKMI